MPGPQIPLYVLGRELEDVFPVAFLPEDHALALAIMSYNGGIDFGLLGDYDAMEDIEMIATGINESLADLLAAAESREANAVADRHGRGPLQLTHFLRRILASARGGAPRDSRLCPRRRSRSGSGVRAWPGRIFFLVVFLIRR